MPLVLAPNGQGWMKVPPKPRKRTTPACMTETFKSPLAYFACTPVPAPKPRFPPHCPVYTLDPNKHTPPGSRRSASSPGGSGGGGKMRHRHPYDEEQEEGEHGGRYADARTRARGPSSTISHERVRPRAPPVSNRAPIPTSSAPKQRAATTTTAPGTYWTGPSNARGVPPRSAAWSGGGGGGSAAGGGGGGGVKARWANATAPLAL